MKLLLLDGEKAKVSSSTKDKELGSEEKNETERGEKRIRRIYIK